MFRKSKIAVIKDRELLDNIKTEIEIQLRERGVMISGINIEMNPENISLRILINNSKRLA